MGFFDKNTDWTTFSFIAGYHVALVIALPWYLMTASPSLGLLLLTGFVLVASLMSITMGYHRLYSHRTFEAKRIVEAPLMFFGTVAFQGSIMRWSHDHRLHHAHSDKPLDPYGVDKGFWHAHCLWLFKKQAPINPKIVPEMMKRKVLVFQERHYPLLAAIANILVIAAAGLITGDWIGSFVFVFLLRLFLGHHMTWFINSLAHMWGARPYSKESSAVNNFIIALLTYGEGYHNYHHTFASDYRNGIKWYHFDPSKHAIWLLSKVGLTSNLKRVNDLTIQKKLVAADHTLMLDHLRQIGSDRMDNMQQRIDLASASLQETIAGLRAARISFQQAKTAAAREEFEAAKARMQALKKSLRYEFRAWQLLCDEVLTMKPMLSPG